MSETSYILPQEIDRMLFNELDAIYQPGENFDLNLPNNAQKNRIYLGTYFPRSFVESYQIFTLLLNDKLIQQSINLKKYINILDIGTGTGGNVIGMMKAMVERGVNSNVVKIFSIEGNENASFYFKRIVDRFNSQYNTHFVLQQEKIIFSTENLKEQMTDYLREKSIKFDFITSSKFLGEFYNQSGDKDIRLFQSLTEVVSKYLHPEGIYILLDVVAGSRDHKCTFKTIIMSDELNNYVNSNSDSLKFIFPSPCAYWSSICRTRGCYIEICFKISHSHFQNDESKVAFRIMTHNIFANNIISQRVISEKYKISRKKHCKEGILYWI